RDGRVERAIGSLRSSSGTIGGSLLLAAVEELGCQPGPASPGKFPFVVGRNRHYRDLALGFAVDQRGLQLHSLADERPGALVLSGDGAVLISAPDEGPLPLVQLLRALAPDSQVQVPATKETAQLAPWLPWPPIVPPADHAPTSPPLRMP
ncbi:MAG TPA: hypothetical protein VFI31_12315, partial [Pirellulales bacterium]|nr:hypothetical protein [Pirellulales bacterium]